MNGIRKQLVAYLKASATWVSGGALEHIEWKNPKTGRGYKSSNISRRLRELAEEGVLEAQGNPVEYRYKPQKKLVKSWEEVWRDGRPYFHEVEKEILV